MRTKLDQTDFYIERSTDKIALDAIGQEGVIITIKGPRQMGKSSLLLWVREAAIRSGKQVALFDFQLFDKTALTDPDRFFRQFCDWISDELKLYRTRNFNPVLFTELVNLTHLKFLL